MLLWHSYNFLIKKKSQSGNRAATKLHASLPSVWTFFFLAEGYLLCHTWCDIRSHSKEHVIRHSGIYCEKHGVPRALPMVNTVICLRQFKDHPENWRQFINIFSAPIKGRSRYYASLNCEEYRHMRTWNMRGSRGGGGRGCPEPVKVGPPHGKIFWIRACGTFTTQRKRYI